MNDKPSSRPFPTASELAKTGGKITLSAGRQVRVTFDLDTGEILIAGGDLQQRKWTTARLALYACVGFSRSRQKQRGAS